MNFKIYSRKSVYTGKGESIENQIELCKTYILANYPGAGAEDITVYEDEGFSGKSLDRPQFQRMMCEMVRGDCIVCYRLDRISRSVGDFAGLIETLNSKQVAFLCIREKFDTSTPMGKAMMYIASVFAQLERETIAERVRDNMLLLAKTGRWLGGRTPTGFQAERRQEILVDGKKKTACLLRENPVEAEIVDAIFEQFFTCHSVSGVRSYLVRRKMKSRTGQNFSLPGIKEMLQNPVYCAADADAWDYFTARGADVCFDRAECDPGLGLLSYNKRDYTKGHAPRNPVEKWVIAKGRHRGRVSGQQWVAVQELLTRNKPEGRESIRRNHSALLSGLIRCAGCGGRLLAKSRTGQGGRFDYICQTKLALGTGVCDIHNLGGWEADEVVSCVLADRWMPGGELCRRVEALGRKSGGAQKALDRRLNACDQEVDRLVTLLTGEEVNGLLLERVKARVGALELERATLREAQGEVVDAPGLDGVDLTGLGEMLSALPTGLAEMTTEERREFARLLIQGGEWDGETLCLNLYETGGTSNG